MSQRSDMVRIAAAQIGYHEGKNNDTKYGAWYGLNYQPWCAMFVSWVAAQAKVPVSIVPKYSYVPHYYSYYNASGRYRSRASGYVPRPGDIILYGNNDHVGIVEKVVNGSVYAIEGNTSSGGNNSNGDGVYRRVRALSNSWIKGYGVPAYEEEEDMEKKTIKIYNEDNGQTVEIAAAVDYNAAGDATNYVKLRDVEKVAPVTVGYDAARKLPTVKGSLPEAAYPGSLDNIRELVGVMASAANTLQLLLDCKEG